MSILNEDINVPLPEVRDWYDISLQCNHRTLDFYVPEESLNHCGDIVRWLQFVQWEILNHRCPAICIYSYICKQIIKGELIPSRVSDVQVGWPVIDDNETTYTIMAVTPQHNKESLGIIKVKQLRS